VPVNNAGKRHCTNIKNTLGVEKMKVGIEFQIDVTKIDKARLYKGNKGTYLTMTSFVDLDNVDQYENNGMITHKKNEGEDRAPILGNAKVFWKDQQQAQQPRQHQAQQQASQQAAPVDDFDDDIPF
jgi:single-stranded DNA-binding protein